MMHPLVEAKPGEVREIFQQFARDVHDAAGGCAGWLAIGAVLVMGAAREIFGRYTALPSLWVYGEQGQVCRHLIDAGEFRATPRSRST